MHLFVFVFFAMLFQFLTLLPPVMAADPLPWPGGRFLSKDSDRDGVPNLVDQCPTIAGSACNQGCPIILIKGSQDQISRYFFRDSDRDGIQDSCDPCPSDRNPSHQDRNQCDDNGDGSPNRQDQCPLLTAKGPTGCPAYFEDVKPIIDAKCTSCHGPGGLRQDRPWTSYDLIYPYRSMIRNYVQNRIMPPWPPSDNCGPPVKHKRSLDPRQIEMTVTWIDRGAQQGDPQREGRPLSRDPGLTRVDLRLERTEGYTPHPDPGKADDYRCFLFDWPATRDRFVTGFRVNPDQISLVHHALAFLVPPEKADEFEALDQADSDPGYECFGGPGNDGDPTVTVLGAWGPGTLGMNYPAGTGILVSPESKIVVQIHYSTHHADHLMADRTSVDFKLDDSVLREAKILPWADPSWLPYPAGCHWSDGECDPGNMLIPAHSDDILHSFSYPATSGLAYASQGTFSSSEPLQVHGGGLHMHLLGEKIKLSIERTSGQSSCLLDIPDWNFHWQGAYLFERPVTLRPGDQLKLECQWDNPTDEDIYWGEGTEDEMCLGFIYVTR